MAEELTNITENPTFSGFTLEPEHTSEHDDSETIIRGYNLQPAEFSGIIEQAYPRVDESPSVKADLALDVHRAADIKTIANVTGNESRTRAEAAAAHFVQTLVEKLPTGEIDLSGLDDYAKAGVIGAALIEEARILAGPVNTDQLLLENDRLQREVYDLRKYGKSVPDSTEIIEAARFTREQSDEIFQLKSELGQAKAELAMAQAALERSVIEPTIEVATVRFQRARSFGSSILRFAGRGSEYPAGI